MREYAHHGRNPLDFGMSSRFNGVPPEEMDAICHPAAGPQADVIIVLGGGIRRDGSLTAVSRARIERAAALYHEGVAPRLVLTGRCGAFISKPVSEASAMHTYACALGVPAGVLLLEEQARNTLGNARFTRELFLVPNGWFSLRIVTSDFHARRAESVFRAALGATYDVTVSTASTGSTLDELLLRLLEPIKLLRPLHG